MDPVGAICGVAGGATGLGAMDEIAWPAPMVALALCGGLAIEGAIADGIDSAGPCAAAFGVGGGCFNRTQCHVAAVLPTEAPFGPAFSYAGDSCG